MTRKAEPKAGAARKATPQAAAPVNRAAPRGLRNVLITGVSSTVGRHLAMHLMNDKRVGHVIGTAEDDSPHFFKNFDKDRFTYFKSDILRSRQLRNLFGSREFHDARINTVVHLAFVSRAGLHGERIHRLNVEGTKNLLDSCIAEGSIDKFVFKSSDVVYKLRYDNPTYLDENADLNHDPDADQWIKDRVAAEMLCRAKMDTAHMNIIILRFANIIGRNVNTQLNAYFDGRVIFKNLGFNPMVNLIHMKDVIQAIRQAVHKPVTGIFNISGADTATITTFAELNRRTCIPLPEPFLPVVNFVMRGVGLTDYYYSVDRERMKYSCLLDTTKAREILGFKPSGSVEFREAE
jgi:UDP-glucose 4-epimerase